MSIKNLNETKGIAISRQLIKMGFKESANDSEGNTSVVNDVKLPAQYRLTQYSQSGFGKTLTNYNKPINRLRL